jgi:hypothetical protein
MAVRLDRVLMSSLHESFKDYSDTSTTITVSGTIPTAGADFYVDIPTTRAGTIADIYVGAKSSGIKRLVNYAFMFPEYVSGDVDVEASIYTIYYPSFIRVNISVANFKGVPFASPTRVFDIQAVIFDAPITT